MDGFSRYSAHAGGDGDGVQVLLDIPPKTKRHDPSCPAETRVQLKGRKEGILNADERLTMSINAMGGLKPTAMDDREGKLIDRPHVQWEFSPAITPQPLTLAYLPSA